MKNIIYRNISMLASIAALIGVASAYTLGERPSRGGDRVVVLTNEGVTPATWTAAFEPGSDVSLTSTVSADAVPYGDLPADRFPPNGWDDLQGFSTTGWTELNVTSSSAVGASNVIAPNTPTLDAAAKIEAIIQSTSGNRVIYLPAGSYYLHTKLDITQSNIVIRGDGKGATKVFIVAPSSLDAEIEFRGIGPGTESDITNLPQRGDQTVSVASPGSFAVGGFAHIYDPGKVPPISYPGVANISHFGQIVKITAINADTLTLDMKLGLNFNNNPKITPVAMIQRVGIDNLSVVRDRAAASNGVNNIEFKFANDVFANELESSYLEQGGIAASFSKRVVVVNSDVHDAYSLGGGGQAYGIRMVFNTTQCRITNNKLWNLRHHIILDRGANHCVVSFNSTEPGYETTSGDLNTHGFTTHNNLFEGNMGRNLKWDERSDPGLSQFQGIYNVAYRNRLTAQTGNAISVLGSNSTGNLSHYFPTAIGNLTATIVISQNVVDKFVGANRVNGTVVLGDMASGSSYPVSLYETAKPSFFGVKPWPIFGPSVADFGNANTIPAADRAGVNTPKPN